MWCINVFRLWFCISVHLMRDDFHHSALFCSKQLYLKVKKNKNKIKASFVITQKRWSVTCQERKDVINPSDRGTMHSSLQMVQTLNLLPSGEAPSLSANQKNKAPWQNKHWFDSTCAPELLIYSFYSNNRLLISLSYCTLLVQHLEGSPN